MRAEMYRRLGPGHDELKERLIPKWPPGCRRLTPGDGYLEALVKDNVKTVHSEITRIMPEGLMDETGKLHSVDVIICATGFDVSFKPSFQLLGVDGVDIADEFTPEPHVYLGMAVPKFPNYFTVNGVRGSWATGTALNSIEACLEYILTCAKRVQCENIQALEVKREPIKELYAHMDEWLKGSVWSANCKRYVSTKFKQI
jgi:cation diffusion facilitator CzcD-associated flavoprotein CzcO